MTQSTTATKGRALKLPWHICIFHNTFLQPQRRSEADRSLLSRLGLLQSRFCWSLQDGVDVDRLACRLQEQLEGPAERDGVEQHHRGLLAYVRYLQDRPEEAVLLLNQSEERTRERFGEESERRLIVTYGDLAWLSYHTGDYTLCEAYCGRVEDILLKNPTGSPSVLLPEVYAEKAWTFLKVSVHYYPRAIECYRKAVELQPDNSEWNSGYAVALYRNERRNLPAPLSEEDSPAVRQLRRALELSPNNGSLLALLALRLWALQQHQEAEELVQQALELGPDGTVVTRYIIMFFCQQDDMNRSIELLKRALHNNKESAFIHQQLAFFYKDKKVALFKKTYYNEEMQYWRRLMIEHLEEAVRLRPSFLMARAELAMMYAEEQQRSRAKELFQETLMMSSERDKYIRQFVHLRFAQFHHYHTREEATAIQYYTKGLQATVTTMEGKKCAEKLRQMAERRLARRRHDGEALALLDLVCRTEAEGEGEGEGEGGAAGRPERESHDAPRRTTHSAALLTHDP
ncbi:interferon-induced protein with tetratricopeptide repeats 1-like [Myripristis murdjan]|uniref:interferon-induced protein with tetratricopeptide repeats 1-like n=1 Tax=Myripristis murdjan TaxID=586833 RepID=UPI0011760E74|nr:interferon-induced protein with tetratricopeptide repeats 1-like [Myripristis murdjan]